MPIPATIRAMRLIEYAKILIDPVKEPKVSMSSSFVVISKSLSSPGETFLKVLKIPITSSRFSL